MLLKKIKKKSKKCRCLVNHVCVEAVVKSHFWQAMEDNLQYVCMFLSVDAQQWSYLALSPGWPCGRSRLIDTNLLFLLEKMSPVY